MVVRLSNDEAVAKLHDAGATLEIKEDYAGITRSGWWQEECYLGPQSEPREALLRLYG